MIKTLTKKFLASIIVCLLLASMFAGVAMAKEEKVLVTNNEINTSIQVIRDPAVLALYDEAALVNNPYYNTASIKVIYAGLEQAVDQEAYFYSLPKEAQDALIADYVNSTYEFKTTTYTLRNGMYWTHNEVHNISYLGQRLYGYSLIVEWDGNGTSTSIGQVYNVVAQTAHSEGNGWGFKGNKYNANSGYKNSNTEYWAEVCGDFAMLFVHDYVDIQITVYSDGTDKLPNPVITGGSPDWWKAAITFLTFLPFFI